MKIVDEKSRVEGESPAEGKMAYTSPELISYGTLREITLSLGNKGAKDGGTGKNNNTAI